MKVEVNKCLKFQNKIPISIFFSFLNQLLQLENYVENILYQDKIKHKIQI